MSLIPNIQNSAVQPPSTTSLQASAPSPQPDYTTHPALTPPADPGNCPFLTLADDTIARILFLAHQPRTRQVCHRFAQIEHSFMPEMEPQSTDALQKKRIERKRCVSELENLFKITPEPEKKHLKSAHEFYSSHGTPEEAKRIIYGNYPFATASAAFEDYPLSKQFMELYGRSSEPQRDQINLVQKNSEVKEWILQHKDKCTSLTFCWANFLPPELQEMPCLRSLTIIGAQFTEPPDWFYALPITDLEFMLCPASLVTAIIGKMKCLERLVAQWCGISHIPVELAHMPHLKSANFTCNQIIPVLSSELQLLIINGKLELDKPSAKPSDLSDFSDLSDLSDLCFCFWFSLGYNK